jgi:hypothetical protein
MKAKSIFAFSFLFVLAFFNSFAQSTPQFISATKEAACYELCYYNNYLYAGAGNTLMVYALDGPNASPGTLAFEHRFVSNIINIQQHNGFLYVSANHSGLSKWSLGNPALPVMLTEYVPVAGALDEALYDIAFFGDTIFAAMKTKVGVLLDSGGVITKLTTFAQKTGNTRIRGIDIKGNLLAFTVCYSAVNANDGVYLHNAATLAQLGFYNQVFCEPQEVVFGQNTSLLHVMGGSNGFDGLFYSLDVSNPSTPSAVFQDTVQGFLLAGNSIGQPMNAVVINDTIYVATQGGRNLPLNITNFNCATYVYDATSAGNVHLLSTINSGLYHFDIQIHNKKMYVASEWYGILSVDISDIYNEVIYSKVLTGGWNISSDKFANKLVQANEGYGIRLYDISNLQNPVLTAFDTVGGFCFSADFSSNGNYIYGYYLTGQQFRVFDVNNNLQMVGSFSQDVGENRTCVYQNKAISASGSKISIIDVSVPSAPAVQSQLSLAANDMLVTSAGKLFIGSNDSLRIYDISGAAPVWLNAIPHGLFQSFHSMAFYKDTLYVYVNNYGLTRYLFNNSTNALIQDTHVTLTYTDPERMAADSFGLYLGYTTFGLRTHSKSTLAYSGNYLHALDFVQDGLWGVQDLYCKDNLIFLNEYFGQTSIFSNDINFSVGLAEVNHDGREDLIELYPNPASQSITVGSGGLDLAGKRARIYNGLGELVLSVMLHSEKTVISLDNFKKGIYFLSVETNKNTITKKFVVAK